MVAMLAMLAEACREQGIKLFFYHSQLDWRHPDYYPRGRTGGRSGRPDEGNWYDYLDFMDAQLRELLTNYGEIGGIWFDGEWDRYDADWRLEQTYSMIHELQPQALIGSNHHLLPHPGEDYQMFEKDLPGGNTAGFNTTEIGQLPLETAETMNRSWGYHLTDRNFKSTPDLIRYLVNAAGRNANFLLNVGPMPTGEIQPEFATRLREMGAWLEVYGESIYGTRGGPIAPRPWGVTTQKGNRIFLHVLDWQDQLLSLPTLPTNVTSAFLLESGESVDVASSARGITISLSERTPDLVDMVVVLEVER